MLRNLFLLVPYCQGGLNLFTWIFQADNINLVWHQIAALGDPIGRIT